MFADPLSLTIADPDGSADEDRSVILGASAAHRLLVVVHVERGDAMRIVSARRPRLVASGGRMRKKPKRATERMRDEYDFSAGVRGKHARKLANGASVVVLEPDVARAFRDSASVNEALRALLHRKKKRAQ